VLTRLEIGGALRRAQQSWSIEADLLAAVPAGDDWEVVFSSDGFGFANRTVRKGQLTLDSK
jgi:hypothetical protein